MPLADVLTNILAIIIFLGGPLVPLLYLAVRVGHWHDENAD
jgi:hypothetical protein